MKRGFCLILCLILLLVSDAHARKKKRKKGEPVICKKGKLIFEDDFSGKELEWVPIKGEWRIAKKALVTESVDKRDYGGANLEISRPFKRTRDVIFELRIFSKEKLTVNVGGVLRLSTPGPLYARISSWDGTMSILGYTEARERFEAVVHPFPYQKPKWVTVLFEAIGNEYALTVDGRSIKCEATTPEAVEKSVILVNVDKPKAGTFAIDDVKVWEALPKDEEDEKGKKKRKRR